MATDQGVGGSNPLTHVKKSLEKLMFSRLFSCLKRENPHSKPHNFQFCVDMDRSQQVFALAGILAFTDKIIDRETANRIKKNADFKQQTVMKLIEKGY